jgi:hypothetical protein
MHYSHCCNLLHSPMITLDAEVSDKPYLNRSSLFKCDDISSGVQMCMNDKLDPLFLSKKSNKRSASTSSIVEAPMSGVVDGIDATCLKRRYRQHGFQFCDWNILQKYDYELAPLKDDIVDVNSLDLQIIGSSSSDNSMRSDNGNIYGMIESQFEKKTQYKRCQFNETVCVMTIPSRHEYTQKMKSRLWFTASELYMNAVRNTIEYMAEGCNWRTVIEEEGMISCNQTGRLIHPAHYTEPLSPTIEKTQHDDQMNDKLQVKNCSIIVTLP